MRCGGANLWRHIPAKKRTKKKDKKKIKLIMGTRHFGEGPDNCRLRLLQHKARANNVTLGAAPERAPPQSKPEVEQIKTRRR